jgi:hypothetical protein
MVQFLVDLPVALPLCVLNHNANYKCFTTHRGKTTGNFQTQEIIYIRSNRLASYVSIRQHTSAYVSIRQHTSGVNNLHNLHT